MQAAQKPRRVILFDELRGVMILSMLAYHICYDLAEVVRLPGMGWFYSDAAGWWQLSICGTFILISGACCFYSKNNLKRGLRLFLLGMLFTLVTALIVPDLLIVFGLLHFLGIAVLLAVPLKKLFERIPPVWGMGVSLLLFWLFYHVQSGWIGLTPQLSLRVPDVLYQSNWLFPFGFHNSSFHSSDYFPLFPYLFLFWAGMFLVRLRLPELCYHSHCRALAFLGRNSIWIYLFHQPLVYGLLWLIFRF